MANLDFFAARSDLKAVVDFLFQATDVRLFESYSRFGQELREFFTFGELDAAYNIGVDPQGNGTAALLQIWSASVMRRLDIERIPLHPGKCKGHTFRYCIEGGGLIQLYLGGVHGRIVTKSHFGHNSERRAQVWGVADGVNWDGLKKLSNKIQYHIRNRLAVAKVPGRPVLPEAYSLAKAGYQLKEMAQAPWQYSLDPDGAE
jgi:hypothetical protein